jgi:hypothetical protein
MRIIAAIATTAVAVAMLVGQGASQTVSAQSAQEVSLVGTWTGERSRSAMIEGYRSGPATLVITEQKGLAFKGYLSRSNKDGDVKEDLWGAFTPGARLIAGADEEGVYSFLMIDENTLDYCYVESGKGPRAVCARLVRKR